MNEQAGAPYQQAGFLIIEQVTVQVLPDGRMDTRNSSAYVGLSPKTLAMMRCAGTGPPYVKLGKVFYFKKDLDDWIELGRVTNTVQPNK